MGQTLFDEFQQAIIDTVSQNKSSTPPINSQQDDDDAGSDDSPGESQHDLFIKEPEQEQAVAVIWPPTVK